MHSSIEKTSTQDFFINRPEPYTFETLEGYCRRIRQANYSEQESYIYSLIGLPHNSRLNYLTYNDKALEKFSGLTLLDMETIYRMTVSSIKDTLHIRSPQKDETDRQNSPLNSISHIGREHFVSEGRYCSYCLQTTNTYYLNWLLRFVVLCPVHNSPLLDRCPKCSKKIRDLDNKCKNCGFDFENTQGEILDDNNPLVVLNDLLLAAYGLQTNKSHKVPANTLNTPFFQIANLDFIQAVMKVSRLVFLLDGNDGQKSYPWKEKFVKDIYSLDLADLKIILGQVKNLFFNFPTAWFEILGRLSRVQEDFRTGKQSGRISNKPTNLIGLFDRLFRENEWHWLWDTVRQYLDNLNDREQSLIGLWKPYINKHFETKGSMPYSSVIRCISEINLSGKTVNRLIEANVVKAVNVNNLSNSQSRKYLLDEANFSKLKEIYQDLLSSEEVSSLLGVGKWATTTIIRSGLLETEQDLISRIPKVQRQVVEKFLKEYYFSIPVKAPVENEKIIWIKNAIFSLRVVDLDISSILTEVNNGNIIAFRTPDSVTLEGVWFLKSEIDKYREKKYLSESEVCGPEYVCELLKCTKVTAKQLIEKGLFQTIPGPANNGRRWSISTKSLLEFTNTFVRIQEAANILNVHRHTIRAWIRSGKLPREIFITPTERLVFFHKERLLRWLDGSSEQ